MSNLFTCLTKQPAHHEVLKVAKSVLGASPDGKISTATYHKLQAAFLKGKQWAQGQTIHIAFLKDTFQYQGQYLSPQYSDQKAAFVQQVINTDIAPLVNLHFEWDVDVSQSDVRISFIPDLGAWSYIGTDNTEIEQDQPTMNLGWIDNDSNYDAPQYRNTGIVVIHEFGHMLGMIHEHSRADSNLQWNKPVIYKALGGPPNNWPKSQVDQQVFATISVDSFNGSAYDPSSVMHYIFPPDWFLVDPHLPTVTKLSPLDIEWISKTYPAQIEGFTALSNRRCVQYNPFIITGILVTILCILYLVLRMKTKK